MSEFVADASAILAFAQGERGMERVEALLPRLAVSTVNLMEAFSKLLRAGMPKEEVRLFLRETFPRALPLTREQAEQAAAIHAATRKLGLSYADCVCLAVGLEQRAVVLTTDGKWAELELGVKVELLR